MSEPLQGNWKTFLAAASAQSPTQTETQRRQFDTSPVAQVSQTTNQSAVKPLAGNWKTFLATFES